MIFKRIFDIIFSLVLLFILAMPLLFLAVIIRLESNGPSIFYSKRFGKDNKIFLMPKFRTMKMETPLVATNSLYDSEKYITGLGKRLRKSSLDELPQLWSIFIGDMSFVGPRPALFNQHDLILLRENYNIHSLTPGLTGWAQVNGRDKITINKKVEIERFYQINQSMKFDLKILYLTFLKVIKMNDIKH